MKSLQRITFTLLFIYLVFYLRAQDTIVLKDGKVRIGEITEFGKRELTLSSATEGPALYFIISLSEIDHIVFSNGVRKDYRRESGGWSHRLLFSYDLTAWMYLNQGIGVEWISRDGRLGVRMPFQLGIPQWQQGDKFTFSILQYVWHTGLDLNLYGRVAQNRYVFCGPAFRIAKVDMQWNRSLRDYSFETATAPTGESRIVAWQINTGIVHRYSAHFSFTALFGIGIRQFDNQLFQSFFTKRYVTAGYSVVYNF